jgi:hypothetical protein
MGKMGGDKRKIKKIGFEMSNYVILWELMGN